MRTHNVRKEGELREGGDKLKLMNVTVLHQNITAHGDDDDDDDDNASRL